MPNLIDLTGKVFGHLTVLRQAPSRGGKTYWLCKCDCGTEKEIRGTSLSGGITTHCGCRRSANPNISTTMKKKICPICQREFETNINNRKYCYDCSPSGNQSATIRKRAIKHRLIAYKGGKCEICGYDKCEGALQFHHINPDEKEFQISDKDILEDLFKEVDKCQLLCANCHIEKHYG